MGRAKEIKKMAEREYFNCAINFKYNLCCNNLDSLRKSLNDAKSKYKSVTAVRLDFSLKKAPKDQYIGLSNEAIKECFETFMNRIYRCLCFEFIMNWKIEWSEAKGFHIHSVFYFDHDAIKAFTLTSRIYKIFVDKWNKATNDNGNINICKSTIADNEETYKIRGKLEYSYVIITDDISLLSKMKLTDEAKKFHLQKNKLDKKCGFFHWISYLAKTEQVAPNERKRFGSKKKNLN